MDTIPSGITGSLEHSQQNVLNANVIDNPIGDMPQLGSVNGSLDAGGATVMGGQNAPPPSERSGISSSGRGAATDCMTAEELNAQHGDNEGGKNANDPRGLGADTCPMHLTDKK